MADRTSHSDRSDGHHYIAFDGYSIEESTIHPSYRSRAASIRFQQSKWSGLIPVITWIESSAALTQ